MSNLLALRPKEISGLTPIVILYFIIPRVDRHRAAEAGKAGTGTLRPDVLTVLLVARVLEDAPVDPRLGEGLHGDAPCYRRSAMVRTVHVGLRQDLVLPGAAVGLCAGAVVIFGSPVFFCTS